MISVSITIQVFGCGGQLLTLRPECPCLASDLKEVTSSLKPRMYCYTGVHKFLKNVDTTPKFKLPEWWYEASYILRTHNVGVTWDYQWCLVLSAWCLLVNCCIFLYVKEKAAWNVLKVLAATAQNLVTWVSSTWICAPLFISEGKRWLVYIRGFHLACKVL